MSKPQSGGFRTYIRGLLYGLSEVDIENEYFIYLDRLIDTQSIKLPQNSKLKIISGNRIATDHYLLKRQITADRPDVVHFPCNYGIQGLRIPSVITLLDCISLLKSDNTVTLKSKLLTTYSAWMTSKTVPKADAIITISEYSRQQIQKFFKVDTRITVVHLAGSIVNVLGNSMRDFNELLDKPYFLTLASVDPRKNTKVVIEAFKELASTNSDCRLVVVASHDAAAEMIRQNALEQIASNRIVILAKINDLELQHLYRNSVAFIFASLDEGFGLPPLEAMSCGCPVASSNCASMPEILGDSALYFNPHDKNDISNALTRLLNDSTLREELRKRGLEQTMRYSWSKTAERTLSIYKNLVHNRD
ncbi:MAG: glycosyltransferase family 4 protein [Armatimonadota bacterium]